MRDITEMLNGLATAHPIDLTEYDLACQKLFDAKRMHDESALPQGVWSMDATLSLEEIENSAWKLLMKRQDCKLLGLWLVVYLKLYGLEGLNTVLDVLNSVFVNYSRVFSIDSASAIDYLDKSFSSAVLAMDCGEDITIAKMESLPEQLRFELTNKDYERLNQFASKAKSEFNNLYTFSFNTYSVTFEKTKRALEILYNFIIKAPVTNSEAAIESLVIGSRDDALRHIAMSIQILEEIDKSSLLLPMLRKVLEWGELNSIEILQELGDAQKVELFLRIFG